MRSHLCGLSVPQRPSFRGKLPGVGLRNAAVEDGGEEEVGVEESAFVTCIMD